MAKGPEIKLAAVKRVHRHFLYLNGDEVLASLASLRGGEVEEVLEKSLKEAGGAAGTKFSLFGAGLTFGGKRRRQTSSEVRRRQTAHSAVTVLQNTLYDEGGIGRLADCRNVTPRALENLVVEFEAQIHLLTEPSNGWNPSLLGWPFKTRLTRRAQARAKATDDGLVACAELDRGAEQKRNLAVLSLREKYLLTSPEGFGRRATVLGQVEAVTSDNERFTLGRGDSGDCIQLEGVGTREAGRDEGPALRADSEGAGEQHATGGQSTERDSEPSSAQTHPTLGEDEAEASRLEARVHVRPFCIYR